MKRGFFRQKQKSFWEISDRVMVRSDAGIPTVISFKLPNKTFLYNILVTDHRFKIAESNGDDIFFLIWIPSDAMIGVGKTPLARADSDLTPLYYSASCNHDGQITVFAFEIY